MECSFCGEEIEKGTGKIYVLKKGKRFFYCSSKCEKNHRKLNKKPQNTKWIQKQSKKN